MGVIYRAPGTVPSDSHVRSHFISPHEWVFPYQRFTDEETEVMEVMEGDGGR